MVIALPFQFFCFCLELVLFLFLLWFCFYYARFSYFASTNTLILVIDMQNWQFSNCFCFFFLIMIYNFDFSYCQTKRNSRMSLLYRIWCFTMILLPKLFSWYYQVHSVVVLEILSSFLGSKQIVMECLVLLRCKRNQILMRTRI